MSTRHLFTIAIVCSIAFTLAACGDDSGGNNVGNDVMDDGNTSDTPTSNATAQEISQCKEACNQLKFFDCNDSVEHATCFQNCEVSDSSGIELFVNCVGVDICDPTCGTNIEPADPPPPPPTNDCPDLCESFASECAPELSGQCAGLCSQATDQEIALATYCLGSRNGCNLPEECEGNVEIGGPDPVAACQSACGTEAFFSCITSADQATCRDLCGSVDDSTRDNYTACVDSGGSTTGEVCGDCYELLDPSGPSADVAGCQAACDDLAFFDCIDAGQQASCRTTCESAEASVIDNFKACEEAQGICEDASCLDVLGL